MRQIIKISEDYFDYMAQNFPVCVSSDEFYFFPRVTKGARFLNCLDCLDEQKIKQDIRYVKNLKSFLERLNSKDMSLEAQIDVTLLNQSMSTFLREFQQLKIWQIDPTLYLKVLLLGIDQFFSSFSFLKQDFGDNLRARMAQIPRLLNEATNNLKKVPPMYLETACELVDASIDYFKTTAFALKNKSALLKEINALTKEILHSLEDFKIFLIKLPSCKSFIKDRQLLEDILKDSFSYKRGLKEIFDIASEEYHRTLRELAQVARIVKSGESWQQILSAYRIDVKDTKGLLRQYSNEIQKIRNFFKEKNVITIPWTQNIQVKPTPQFMKPIRASASYSSPVTADRRESAYFYITCEPVKSNIHNEYCFVTAHEAFAGHHLLDSIRRSLKNPIRRQIESPFFYEGWASYAEVLIDELGYIENPLQRLVGLRRQAWRAVRAMLDVGIRINKFKVADAAKLLKGLGYEPGLVELMLRHYILLPGYQLCYTIGKFEIDRLKKKFSAKLGLKRFHDFLLQGGQIPFDLIETRMEQLCRKNS